MEQRLINAVAGASPERVVSFTVPGEPRSKQRPRVTQRGTFTPKVTLDQERRVLAAWLDQGEPPFEYQMVVDIDFFLGTRYRKDIDNMGKLVLDALNKHAFEDDHAVVGLNLRKINSSKENARTVVRLKEVILWPDEQ